MDRHMEQPWSQRWSDGLVERAGMDADRLSRGRTARKMEQVGAIEVEPGIVRAVVHTTSEARTLIGVAPLAESRWETAMGLITSQASLSAALLSGELPEELAEFLLPARGEVSCDCSCADGGEPCVHAAALLHAVGDLFDVEPFALMLIRGRGRNDLLTEVRKRRSQLLGVVEPERIDLPRGVDPGVNAAESWRHDPKPLETSPRLPRQPGSLVTLAAPPPSDSGIDESDLRLLVADAASRAHSVLTGDGDTGLSLSTGADVVRRAASGDVARISAATKVPLDELSSAAQAWQFGGAPGLRVSRRKWEPTSEQLQPGILALGPNARARANRVSLLRSQLRLDEDGLWWLFHADDELGWVLASESAADPVDLV